MILPGISGSFILVLLGKYFYIMSAVKSLDIVVMLVFICGAFIGITSFSNVLSFLLRRFHNTTIATLAGFMLGSLNKVWPWKETVETYVDSHGHIKPLVEENILPNTLLWEGIGLMLFGFILVYVLEKISQKK
jgi:putative membrane protein